MSNLISPVQWIDRIIIEQAVMPASGKGELTVSYQRIIVASPDGRPIDPPQVLPLHPGDAVMIGITGLNAIKDQFNQFQEQAAQQAKSDQLLVMPGGIS